jgi:uncharacterized protein (TIGR00288 family)
MEKQLKIAVFIDFDNIEIGVKSTLGREFDVAAVLEALKERGEIVTKIAYANWGRLENFTRTLSEHAVQMVQRDPSPRGDKNGADINLALDALELAFTHDHINAFAIVSGDSDFIALVNKLKQYDKTIFVVGGKAFTSTILQKNCHEFISYENLLDNTGSGGRAPAPPREERPPQSDSAPASQKAPQQQSPRQQQPPQQRRPVLELAQAMPLVERALQVLDRREVRPQLGLLKSTMLQLDSSFSEKAYGANSFTDFVEKLRKQDYVNVTGGEGRYMISLKRSAAPEKTVRPEEALPILRDVLETHRLEMEEGVLASDLTNWVREEQPEFDWKKFGFQEFSEFLNFAQDKSVVRVQPDEEQGLFVHLGAEFHPPALPEPEPTPIPEEEVEVEEKQPYVPGQPTAKGPRTTTKRAPRKTGPEVNGNTATPPKVPRKRTAATTKRPRKTPPPPGVMQ